MDKKNYSSGLKTAIPPNEALIGLSIILQMMPGNVFWKDLNGVYLGCNEEFLRTNHLTEVIGKTDFDMPWSEQAQQIRQNDLEVMRLNKSHEYEEHILLPHAQQHFTFLTKKTPLKDLEGNTIGIIGVSFNITARKNYESNLKYINEQTASTLENIVANMPGHVFWKDKNGVYLGCNTRQANSLGFQTPKDVIGKTDFDLPWEKGVAMSFRENDLRIMKTKIAEIVEEESQMDGQRKIVLSHKTPMLNSQSEVTGVLGISLDITDRKLMEKELKEAKDSAEAANLAKTEFLYNMRHDVRSPLSGIIGFAELLHSESQEPRVREYSENLVASSHALLDFMDEVLEAVRVSSGEIPILKKKFELVKVFEKIVSLYSAKAKEKNIALAFAIDDSLPRFLIGDKIRLHRIALELVGNALNFTDQGQVAVHVSLAKKKEQNLIVKLTVEDTGIGIPKDKQHEIYLQFKRLTPSYQGIYKGSGLGLYIIKQFIDEMNGEIYVESEPRKGSRFTCILPLQASLLDDDFGIEPLENLKLENSYMNPLHFRPPISLEKGSKKEKSHILVVEDNAIAQKASKSILSAMNCHVDLVSNGEDAIKLCTDNHYDLVFMDIGLGVGMDGYEVTRQIRNLDDEHNSVPIIALTAHAGDENKQRCIEAGMDAVLCKPLNQTNASDIINTFIPSRNTLSSTSATTVSRRDLPDNNEELFELRQFLILDSKQAIKSCGSLEILIELLTLTLNEVPVQLEQMKEAFANKDFPLVEKIAHKIKGGAVYIGTTRMKYACQYLERYWKAGQRELFEKLGEQAVAVIEETLAHIQLWLKSNQ